MTKSISTEIIIKNKLGLHARPASVFVRTASKFESEITVESESEKVNGKSLINLLMLSVSYNNIVKITASGPDCNEAIQELQDLVETNKTFNEE